MRRSPGAIFAVTAFTAVIAVKAYNDGVEERAVATLTIRDLDDSLKSRLRMRAAARNRSMEEEARQILRAALQEPVAPTLDLGTRIRARFAALGDMQLAIEARQPLREPPELEGQQPAGAPGKPKASTTRR